MANGSMEDAPWYVCRPILNPLDIIKWAKENGFKKCYAPTDFHVTICYSKEFFSRPDYHTPARINIPAAKVHRGFDVFGDNKDTNVIKFFNEELMRVHKLLRKHGASFDFPEYQPHISFSSDVTKDKNAITPYYGPIILGKEKWDVIKSDWKPKEEEASAAPLMDVSDAESMAHAMTSKDCKDLVAGVLKPKNSKLWKKCKEVATLKFKQYPSHYAKYHTAKSYIDNGGKW